MNETGISRGSGKGEERLPKKGDIMAMDAKGRKLKKAVPR